MKGAFVSFLAATISHAVLAREAPPRGAPQEVLDSQTCQELLLERVPAEYPVAARKAHMGGYVVSTFDLDGSGKATNIKVVEAAPPKTFDAAALASLGKATFKSGAVAVGCRYVSDFAAATRR